MNAGGRRRCAFRAVIGGMAVVAATAMAAPVGAPSTSLRLLASIGCARVPEASGPDHVELQCSDDRAYFLCTAMQAQDARLDCAIDPTASRVDMNVDPAIATARPAFAWLAEAEPCVAWAYPEPNADKQRHGAGCARGILASLHCTLAASGVSCPAPALPACQALRSPAGATVCAAVKP